MRPYHIQVVQALTAVQKPVCMECCQILAEMTNIQPDIVNLMAFSDEATFHTSGHVNRHNTIFWGMENPHVIREHKRDSPKVNVWCAVTAAGVIGPYFFDTPTVTSDVYLQMVQQYTIDELPLQIRLAGYFQQNGAPPHFALTVCAYLDHTFPGRWIGRSRPLLWHPHSPDLTPCHFWLWGMVKECVYNRKIRDINDLKDRIQTVVSSIPCEMCVWALNGTVAHWLLCVKHNGEQVETVL